jgi:hypothetical protein
VRSEGSAVHPSTFRLPRAPRLPPRLCRSALARQAQGPIRSCDSNVDTQAIALDLDLQPANSLPQHRHVLIEGSNLLTCSGALRCRGAACSARHALASEILLGHALNDLPPLVHAVEQLRLEVDETLAQIRELPHRAQLFGSIGEKIWIVDD